MMCSCCYSQFWIRFYIQKHWNLVFFNSNLYWFYPHFLILSNYAPNVTLSNLSHFVYIIFFDEMDGVTLSRLGCNVIKLYRSSLCSNLSEVLGFRPWIICVFCINEVSSGDGVSRKLSIVLFRWTPALCLSKNNVLVMGDLTQWWYLMRVISLEPPYLASMNCDKQVYIFPILLLSLRAFCSCFPMHLK